MEEEKLRVALVRSGLSQTELAARLGLHTSTVSRIICGWHVPNEEVQAAIRDALAPYGRRLRFGYQLSKKRRAGR